MSVKYSKAQIIDFSVLALRWYLAYYMADYGWGKMTGGQFGLHDPTMLDNPLREVDKFYLAWYLFSLDNTFNIVVGLTQITGAVLMVFNRTVPLGSLLLLPVLGQIFLLDLAFTTNVFGPALPMRLAEMIVADLLIMYYYRERMVSAFINLTEGVTTRFRYKWWVFLLMPVIGLLTDFFFGVLTLPLKWLIIWLQR